MISRLQFKFGAGRTAEPLLLDVATMNILVGPNNSGKSLSLKELYEYCTGVTNNSQIINAVEFTRWGSEEIEQELQDIKDGFRAGIEVTSDGEIQFSSIGTNAIGDTRSKFQEARLRQAALGVDPRVYTHSLVPYYTLKMDADTRMKFVGSASIGNLRQRPRNHLAILFRDDTKRKVLRNIVHESFGKYLVIDPTHGGSLRLALADEAPESVAQERSLHEESLEYFKKSMPIAQFSDGVKAFVGTLTAVYAGEPRIILIDEPEAFLHPTLAHNLGKELGKVLNVESKKQLFAATHSSHFLMGCIQSGVSINVIRLTYTSNSPTVRVLDAGKVIETMREPLLRSTKVLDALFHEFAIITEADSDRAFYQEVNERLLLENANKGISNCIFLNAQNKQTVWKIIKPLRDMGIPACGIVDIDAINLDGSDWTKLMDALNVPIVSREGFGIDRANLYRKFQTIETTTGKKMKRDGGVKLLDANDQIAFRDFVERLAAYGLFILECGELENWLSGLGVTVEKRRWLVSIFEKMGSDPNSSDYVRPQEDDVWNFITSIRKWFMNSNRKGMEKA